MTDLEISLKTSQFDMDFPSPPPFVHPQKNQATEYLSPLDRLLAEDTGERDFRGQCGSTHTGKASDREANSTTSGIPSVDIAYRGKSGISQKFTWFKKKP
ncbi:hypothetical protein DSO57_1022366 [Entomophthora muscae]|uniref:Uncharacterized protein n=1 Tax=Entomophthora muscae TaxID=34485 RepID=A0ACC2TE89_9FUNG|nr:hypothetical protein DSO57_1022366 [Entomophthora muscae]